MECTESNNILNPINFSQYQDLIQEIEEKGLEKVEDEGVRQEAEKNLKVLIEGFLSEFSDYETHTSQPKNCGYTLQMLPVTVENSFTLPAEQ